MPKIFLYLQGLRMSLRTAPNANPSIRLNQRPAKIGDFPLYRKRANANCAPTIREPLCRTAETFSCDENFKPRGNASQHRRTVAPLFGVLRIRWRRHRLERKHASGTFVGVMARACAIGN